jgi:hypothetical protein
MSKREENKRQLPKPNAGRGFSKPSRGDGRLFGRGAQGFPQRNGGQLPALRGRIKAERRSSQTRKNEEQKENKNSYKPDLPFKPNLEEAYKKYEPSKDFDFNLNVPNDQIDANLLLDQNKEEFGSMGKGIKNDSFSAFDLDDNIDSLPMNVLQDPNKPLHSKHIAAQIFQQELSKQEPISLILNQYEEKVSQLLAENTKLKKVTSNSIFCFLLFAFLQSKEQIFLFFS